jgi:hypothetical protein
MTGSDLSKVRRTPALEPAVQRRPGPGRTLFIGLAGLLGLVLTILSGHLLVIGWLDGSDGHARRFDDLAWAAIEGVIVTVGLLAQLRRPERHAAGLRQALVGLLALIAGGALIGAADPATIVVLLLVAVLAVLHPARGEVFRRPGRPDLTVGAIALVIACAAVWWAANVIVRFGGLPPDDVHVQHQDAAGLVGLALGVALTALLATADRHSVMPGVSAGLALLLVCVASLILPGQVDALPPLAAVGAGLAGVLLAALVIHRGHDRGCVDGRRPSLTCE